MSSWLLIILASEMPSPKTSLTNEAAFLIGLLNLILLRLSRINLLNLACVCSFLSFLASFFWLVAHFLLLQYGDMLTDGFCSLCLHYIKGIGDCRVVVCCKELYLNHIVCKEA